MMFSFFKKKELPAEPPSVEIPPIAPSCSNCEFRVLKFHQRCFSTVSRHLCKHEYSIDKITGEPVHCDSLRLSLKEGHCGPNALYFKKKPEEQEGRIPFPKSKLVIEGFDPGSPKVD